MGLYLLSNIQVDPVLTVFIAHSCRATKTHLFRTPSAKKVTLPFGKANYTKRLQKMWHSQTDRAPQVKKAGPLIQDGWNSFRMR